MASKPMEHSTPVEYLATEREALYKSEYIGARSAGW